MPRPARHGPIRSAVEKVDHPVWRVLLFHALVADACAAPLPRFVVDDVVVAPRGGVTLDTATGYPLVVVDAYDAATGALLPPLGYDGRILLPVPLVEDADGEERPVEMVRRHLFTVAEVLVDHARREGRR